MNRTKIFFAIGITIVSLSSCKKDFLDKKPESDLTTGNFYKSAIDAESGLTGAYNAMAIVNFYQYDNVMNTDGRSDNCYVNGDNIPSEQPLENFSYTSSNGNIQRDWRELYNHISAANAVTDNVPNITDNAWANNNRKAQILGEARFLRAMSYYWLVTEWGDCPLILSVTNGGNYYPSCSKASEVYAQIITDLKYADSVLPAIPYNKQPGRATSGAAEALLAKTYAQMGDYANCLIYCNKVIGSNTYSLVSDYKNLWGAANKNNSESIFAIQYDGATNGCWGTGMFSYISSDGWPKRNIGSYDLINAFQQAGDNVRYKATFDWEIANAAFNMPANAWDASEPIPFANKFPGGWDGTNNVVIIRLADIILLAAEANNQLGNLADANILLNQIRTRVQLPNINPSTQKDMALAILNERRLELVYECTRWNDLLRADANGYINLVALMNSQVNSYGQNLNYNVNPDKHQFLFPIPLQDLQLNKNLTPAKGY